MIGNLLEARIIQLLDQSAEGNGHGMHWLRQDPAAILVDSNGVSTETVYEVKAWYALLIAAPPTGLERVTLRDDLGPFGRVG